MKAQFRKYLSHPAHLPPFLDIGSGRIRQIEFLNSQMKECLILSSDKYLIYDTLKKEVVKSLKTKKDKKAQKQAHKAQGANPAALPVAVSLSSDDKFTIEVLGGEGNPSEVLVMRNLVQNSIVAKFEGHSQAISDFNFVSDPMGSLSKYAFVSCAGSECLLWEYGIGSAKDQIEEEFKPAKILNTQSTVPIESISALKVMDGGYLVSALESGRGSYVFMAKVSSKVKVSKVKKPDVAIKLKEKSHNIIMQKATSSSAIQVVFGNAFSMLKQDLSLMDEETKGDTPQLKSMIELKAPGEKQI